jgi:LAO/AO transport system kinase
MAVTNFPVHSFLACCYHFVTFVDHMNTNLFDGLLQEVQSGNRKALARCISLIENEVMGAEAFLENLPASNVPVVGITGPPGAGKSTLVDGLIGNWINAGKKIGVLCVDPSSPFNFGALLGDRIRLSAWYNHPDVFIRSLATRGSLGGLHPHILEIADVMKVAGFDYVLIETVGVGQSEVEIAGLADCTVVVLVPEAGDEIQTMKAGLMEIANVFVVNKADRPDADTFVNNLRLMLAPSFHKTSQEIRVVKTVAQRQEGIEALSEAINLVLEHTHENERRSWLLAEKAWHIIQQKRMKDINKSSLKMAIDKAAEKDFNVYQFVKQFLKD